MPHKLPPKQIPSIGNLDNVGKLIFLGQSRFSIVFEGTGQRFDAPIWEVTHLIRRLRNEQRLTMAFSHRGKNTNPLPQYFAGVVKSWLLLQRSSPSFMITRLDGAKFLWEAILIRRGNDPDRFTWGNLCEEDFRQTEILMLEVWEPLTCYSHLGYLIRFARLLAERQICRSLYFTPVTTSNGRIRYNSFAYNEARLSKLPTKRSLEGLADIYANHAKLPQDRICIAAIALLIVTGFRVGELVALPEKCEIEETHKGKTSYGLYYFPEKTKRGGLIRDIRWLTPTQAELARTAIAEIRDITAASRERAKLLERFDILNIVHIPEFASLSSVSSEQIAKFVGLSAATLFHLVKKKVLSRQKSESGQWMYSKHELEKHLMSLRYKRLWTIDFGNDHYQKLSESLFVIPRLFFRGGSGPTLPLVEPLLPSMINRFIVPKGQGCSAFERFNIREEDGSYCRVTSHQFRHWLNDLADKGGLPIDVLTRWMGRENPRDTDAYRHATVDERLKWVKAGIRTEDITGTMAEVYFDLPEGERDVFLEGQIQAVHFTPMGVCIHDFAIEPCPYHLNCVRGCPHYLRTKGNKKERSNLIQIQVNTEKALEAARQYTAEAGVEVSQTWIQHHEETLKGIRNALAVDDESETSDGELVKPERIALKMINPGGR